MAPKLFSPAKQNVEIPPKLDIDTESAPVIDTESTSVLDSMLENDDSMAPLDLRPLRVMKVRAKKLETQVNSRIENQVGIQHLKHIQAEDYHLPRNVEFKLAKNASEQAQNTAIYRNWPRIKKAFEVQGCVLSIPELRTALGASEITVPHIERILIHAQATLLPGEDLVTINDFSNIFFERYNYETDSDLEAALSESEASDSNQDHQIPWQHRLIQRKLNHLRLKLKTGVIAKRLRVSFSNQSIDSVILELGCSSKFLKLVNHRWVKSKPFVKSSKMTSYSSGSLVERLESALLSSLDYLPSQQSLHEAIELVRGKSACMIQSLARGFLIRLRARSLYYAAVIAKSDIKKFKIFAKNWFERSAKKQFLLKNIFKIFVRWRIHTRVMKTKRSTFKSAFWPFYTWRKDAHAKALAKKKARFLKNVWFAFLQLTHFRAWKSFLIKMQGIRNGVDLKGQQIDLELVKVMLASWRQETLENVQLAITWKTKGCLLQHSVFRNMLQEMFEVWRVYAYYRKHVRSRSLLYYSHVSHPSFFDEHPYRRRKLQLADRKYHDASNAPPFINVRTLLRNKNANWDVLEPYQQFMKLREQEFRRINCIERNRLCPQMLYNWKQLVEMKQKDRYAWYHFTMNQFSKYFTLWKSYRIQGIQESKEKPSRQSIRNSSIKVSSKSSMVPAINPEPLEKPFSHQEYLEAKGRSLEQKWEEEKQWKKKLLRGAIATATDLQKAQLERRIRMDCHVLRLKESIDNTKHSINQAEMLMQDKKARLEIRKIEQEEFTKSIMKNRGKIMHDILFKVFDESELNRNEEMKAKCFQMIKFPMIYKKSFSLLMKNRILNWIRICNRLRKLWRAMPKFHKLRTKWIMFNKWLQFLDTKYMYESPGLRQELQLRKQRLLQYSAFLKNSGEDESLHTKSSWFLRWIEFTQKSIAQKRLLQLHEKKQRLLVLAKILITWRTALKPRHTFLSRSEIRPFFSIQVDHDVWRWKTQMMCSAKRSYSMQLQLKNKYVKRKLKESIKTDDSPNVLKSVLDQFSRAVNTRLNLETKLLCNAFDERGTYIFEDTKTDMVGLNSLDSLGLFEDPEACCGAKVEQVQVFVSDGMVTGLQMYMQSGPPASLTRWKNPIYGSGPSESVSKTTTHTFALQLPDEQLLAIEGFAMEDVVGGKIRFHTTMNRVSAWFGKGDKGVYFKLPETLDSLGNSAFEDEHIIGLYGRQSDICILSLGVIVRQIVQRNVFTNCWMDRADHRFESDTLDIASEEDIIKMQGHVDLQLQLHQRQFQSVVEIREADIERAKDRALKFAKFVRNSNDVPVALRKVNVISKLTDWFFNSQSKGLIKLDKQLLKSLSGKDDGSLTRGYIKISNGNLAIKRAQVKLRHLDDMLHRGSSVRLNAAEISQKRISEMEDQVRFCQQQIKDGKDMVLEGRVIVDHGRGNLPKLQTTKTQVEYFQNLVLLAIVKSTLN